uniref:ATP synthase F0 subunit 8 n=1 Tax=Nembrotha kubaryana TaxID=351409 RepID=A0A1W5YJL9_NEMKU|nr:ATP synthase F0 subunit 8 [Nembrotha kubaryana]ARI43828.1 ATP synthase F0 subunit 8 [Nembrotha kubaryana]
MPQLSPMLGFLIFASTLGCYFILLCSLSKKTPFVIPTKLSKSEKLSLLFFSN